MTERTVTAADQPKARREESRNAAAIPDGLEQRVGGAS